MVIDAPSKWKVEISPEVNDFLQMAKNRRKQSADKETGGSDQKDDPDEDMVDDSA